jgi:hypothetical protein
MQPEYTERDDWGFGRRFFPTALLGSIPVWLGLLIVFWLKSPWPVMLIVFGITLTIPLSVLILRHRWTRCPSCGKSVRVPWDDKEYCRGGELKYTCDRCRIRWNTHFTPGSNVS